MEIRKLNEFEYSQALLILEKLNQLESDKNRFYFWSQEELNLELKEGDSIGLWIEENILVSFIVYRVLPGAQEISFLATDSEKQGQSYMKKLLSHFIHMNSDEGTTWLEVHENNKKGLDLYKRVGFIETGRRLKYYRDGGSSILMECKKTTSY